MGFYLRSNGVSFEISRETFEVLESDYNDTDCIVRLRLSSPLEGMGEQRKKVFGGFMQDLLERLQNAGEQTQHLMVRL